MGPKMITHTQFYYLGINLPIAQDICYTGHSGRKLFCVIRGLHKVLSVSLPITQINYLGINFPIARTFVTPKDCFRIICVIISDLIVVCVCPSGVG